MLLNLIPAAGEQIPRTEHSVAPGPERPGHRPAGLAFQRGDRAAAVPGTGRELRLAQPRGLAPGLELAAQLTPQLPGLLNVIHGNPARTSSLRPARLFRRQVMDDRRSRRSGLVGRCDAPL